MVQLQLQQIIPERILLLIAVAVALVATSWAFNNHIDRQADVDPLGSNSSIYTVLGTAYTLAGALIALTILLGWETALFAVGVILVSFGVSGTPMIFVDMHRGSRRRKNKAHHIFSGDAAAYSLCGLAIRKPFRKL